MMENKIDAMIVAGWRVLENNFSEHAFQEWRKQALDCVVALCGESHPYTDYFKSGVEKARTASVLTGVGLLTAVQFGAGSPNCSSDTIRSSNGRIAVTQTRVACGHGNSFGEVVNS